MKLFILSIIFLCSCSSRIKTKLVSVSNEQVNTENYINADVDSPKYEVKLINHYRTINSNPLLIDSQFLYTTKNGRFFSYDINENKFSEKESYCYGTNLSPLIYKGNLFLFSSVGRESVQVFEDGDKRWSKDIPYGIESMPVADDTGIYVAAANGKIYKLDLNSGDVIWEKQLKKPVHSDLVQMFDLIIISDDSGKLQSLDKQTGNTIWEIDLKEGPSYTKPILLGAKLIFSSINGYIAEINPLLGKVVWERNIDAPIYSTPSSDGKNIYFGSNNGYVYKLNTDGKILNKYATESNVNAQILIGEKNIYFGTGKGEFYSLEKSTFHLNWKKVYKGRFVSSALFWEENLIVFSDNDDVYMLSENKPKTDSSK